MTEIPILDEEYWTALEILADEVFRIRDCATNSKPWHPKDPDRLEATLHDWGNYHTDDPENYFLSFPWPAPGAIPKIPAKYFQPRVEEKAKIKAFIDRHEGDEDPWLREFVVLAKELVRGVH
jgi:hypothetical protein